MPDLGGRSRNVTTLRRWAVGLSSSTGVYSGLDVSPLNSADVRNIDLFLSAIGPKVESRTVKCSMSRMPKKDSLGIAEKT
jgi:hypothetical protein